MDNTIFAHRDIWQHILAFATNGAFLLNVEQPPKTPILTHALTPLRATCRAARAMIPAPTKLTPEQLLRAGAYIGDIAMCKYAFARTSNAKALEDAILGASTLGFYDIVEFMLTMLTYRLLHIAECADSAAAHGNLQICRVLYEHGRAIVDIKQAEGHFISDLVAKSIISGAAKGHHLNIIEFMRQKYNIVDEISQCNGAIWGNHMDLLNVIDNPIYAYERTAIHCVAIAVEQRRMNMCEYFRNFAKKWKILSEEFYHAMIIADAMLGEDDTTIFAETAYKWSMEDGIKINFTKEICYLLKINTTFTSSHGRAAIIAHKLHDECVHSPHHTRINYDAIIRSLGDFAKYAEQLIRDWAHADGFAITETFDRDLYEPYDDGIDDGTLFDIV